MRVLVRMKIGNICGKTIVHEQCQNSASLTHIHAIIKDLNIVLLHSTERFLSLYMFIYNFIMQGGQTYIKIKS